MESRRKNSSVLEYGSFSEEDVDPARMAQSLPERQSERVRKYSWSRRHKDGRLPRSPSQSLVHVTGMAIVVFGTNRSWFRANIVSSNRNDETFVLHGTRRKSSRNDSLPPDEESVITRIHYRDDSGCESEDCIDRLSEANIDRLRESTQDSFSSDASKDGNDDDDDILSSLTLSEICEDGDCLDDETEDGLGLFDAFMLEPETCQTHKIGAVLPLLDLERCELKGDNISFTSSNVLKGNAADRLLCGTIGPSFTGRNLDVYQGEIYISYTELLYQSTPSNCHSRWYL